MTLLDTTAAESQHMSLVSEMTYVLSGTLKSTNLTHSRTCLL